MSLSYRNLSATILITVFFLTACQVGVDPEIFGPDAPDTRALLKIVKIPTTADWHWQLQGKINTAHDALVYDIDLFDAAPSFIDSLHKNKRIVVCSFSAGTHQSWRPDTAKFKKSDYRNLVTTTSDEKWLDITSKNTRIVMLERLDLAKKKKCDAVVPDNVDGYINDTGFTITRKQQIDYNRYLAKAAHIRALAIGLRNALDLINILVTDFDFAVNEQCHEFDECHLLGEFVRAGKPVFNVEYDVRYAGDLNQSKTSEPYIGNRLELCKRAAQLGMRTIVLPLDLNDRFRFSCNG